MPAHVWAFGRRQRTGDHHELVGAASPAVSPRVPVLLYETRPDLVGGTPTLTDELLRRGFKEWGGIRAVHVYHPAAPAHDPAAAPSLRQMVAPHVDPGGMGGDLPIVMTRERRQLASAVEQLAVPGTVVAVLSSAVRRPDLMSVRDLGLNFLTRIGGLGIHVLRDSRSAFTVEPPGPHQGNWRPLRADRLIADLQATCCRHWPRQLVLLVDLDALQLCRAGGGESDAPLVAAALRFVQGLSLQPAVILHSTRLPEPASGSEVGALAKHLGSCLFREVQASGRPTP